MGLSESDTTGLHHGTLKTLEESILLSCFPPNILPVGIRIHTKTQVAQEAGRACALESCWITGKVRRNRADLCRSINFRVLVFGVCWMSVFRGRGVRLICSSCRNAIRRTAGATRRYQSSVGSISTPESGNEDTSPGSRWTPKSLSSHDIEKLSERCTSPPFCILLTKVHIPPATKSLNSLTSDDVGQKHTFHGWLIIPKRKVGKGIQFLLLRDSERNQLQLFSTSRDSIGPELTTESPVAVTGQIHLRPSAQQRPGLGQFELEITKIQALNTVNFILPINPSKSFVNPAVNAEYRYLVLRSPKYHAYLRLRDSIIASCRTILRNQSFMEIETPLLFKSTPEGAREFIVPTRRRGEFYALPQSPQQYKQILMAS